jgi:hypothetical protein
MEREGIGYLYEFDDHFDRLDRNRSRAFVREPTPKSKKHDRESMQND